MDGHVYGQPLYLGNVNIAGKGTHNVVFVATEHDSVYAFDADSGAGANGSALWHVSFINPSAGVTTVPASDTGCDQIVPEIGITGTPVIDSVSGTLYVVAMTKESGGGSASYVHRLHALDVRTGAEKPSSPVAIHATYPGSGEGGSTLVFAPRNYKQRPGLLLLNGVVYTAWSSHCDIGTYHGWLIGYDAKTLTQVTVYNNTPNGNEGSFWTGNAAPAADSNPPPPDGRSRQRRQDLRVGSGQSGQVALGIRQPDRGIGTGCDRRLVRESGILQQSCLFLRRGTVSKHSRS